MYVQFAGRKQETLCLPDQKPQKGCCKIGKGKFREVLIEPCLNPGCPIPLAPCLHQKA